MGRIPCTYHRRLFLILSLMGHIRRTCPRILKGRIQFNIRRRSSRLLFFLLGRIRFFKLFRIPSQPFRMAYTLFCFLPFVGVSCFGLKLWRQVMHLKVVQLMQLVIHKLRVITKLEIIQRIVLVITIIHQMGITIKLFMVEVIQRIVLVITMVITIIHQMGITIKLVVIGPLWLMLKQELL